MSSDVQGRLQENLQENSKKTQAPQTGGTTHRGKTSKKTQAPHTRKTSKKTQAPHTSMDRMQRVAAQQQFHFDPAGRVVDGRHCDLRKTCAGWPEEAACRAYFTKPSADVVIDPPACTSTFRRTRDIYARACVYRENGCEIRN
jgi:hypothetical protein